MTAVRSYFSALNLVWLVLYGLAMTAVVLMLFQARATTLSPAAAAKSRQEWNRWQADVERQNVEGPVHRKPTASADPPAVVLMRDYFGVVVASSLFFSTLLFGMIALAVRGSLSPRSRQAMDHPT